MIGVIGGTGFSDVYSDIQADGSPDTTPFGETSSPITTAKIKGEKEILFIARHGNNHSIAPHRVNYRANIWALKERGVDSVIATYAVGGIDPELSVGDIVVPDQIVDYTWGRDHSFEEHIGLTHIDFTSPFDSGVRDSIIRSVKNSGFVHQTDGIYGVTQGPRLETAAEIKRMKRDGCTVVGMTAMPEAALAKELDMRYAGVCFVVNPAAGIGDQSSIDKSELHLAVETGRKNLLKVIGKIIEYRG